MDKPVLDACCGGRMFWFDKSNPVALFIDKRKEPKGHIQNGWNPNHEVNPDIVMDFTKIDFPDKSFKLVVFDPPHLIKPFQSKTSVMFKKYGTLLADSWKDDLRKGFSECWRVLDDYGTLVFKWGEESVSVKEVLSLFPEKPLFGHPTRKGGTTHWFCFMKLPSLRPQSKESK